MRDFGDRAHLFAIAGAVPSLLDALRSLVGVEDVVLTESIGMVVRAPGVAATDVERALGEVLSRSFPATEERDVVHRIEVVYDGADLDAVASAIGCAPADVVRMHVDATYRVAMVGFLPGFGYLRGVVPPLVLPRRAPRPRVPPKSVALAAGYSGIYPFASPGGWHLLGHAPDFDPLADDGHARLSLGDRVVFVSVPPRETRPVPTIDGGVPREPHLEVTRAQGFAIVVDGGRPGHMHDGVPPGGPLVRSAWVRANAGVSNGADACALEIVGAFEVTVRGGTLTVGDDRGRVEELAEGDAFAIASGRARVAYLAVGGGLAAPRIWGGRGTLLGSGIGELVRRGARLRVENDGRSADLASVMDRGKLRRGSDRVGLLEGPDEVAGCSLEELRSTPFRISSTSNRTGVRLEGGDFALARDRPARRSIPMRIGAIELTPSGLVVLGPDHPTTGGYPVVGFLPTDDLDTFFARPIGDLVRFD